jgi:hypothetical protein
MTDEAETPILAPKKRTGWPKGKPRKPVAPSPAVIQAVADRAEARAAGKPMLAKMRSRPNWDDDTIVGIGEDGADRLRIDPDIVQRLARDGVALQWITRSVRGQDAPQELSKFTKGGWTPVYQSDFDGVLDGMFLPKGLDEVIGVEDAMLVARPMAIHQKAKAREIAMAREPVQIKESELGTGINVPGGNHPSATRQNRINRTVERIEVPKE